jgi:hypothetical protein
MPVMTNGKSEDETATESVVPVDGFVITILGDIYMLPLRIVTKEYDKDKNIFKAI